MSMKNGPSVQARTLRKSPPWIMNSLMMRWNMLPLYPTGRFCRLRISRHGGPFEDSIMRGSEEVPVHACLHAHPPRCLQVDAAVGGRLQAHEHTCCLPPGQRTQPHCACVHACNRSSRPCAQRAALAPVLPGAELSEVLARARADVGKELHLDAARGDAANGDVEEDHWVAGVARTYVPVHLLSPCELRLAHNWHTPPAPARRWVWQAAAFALPLLPHATHTSTWEPAAYIC